MNYKKIVWGAILIITGLIILLSNLNIIQISWRSFFAIWPIIFVFIGISLLPVKESIKVLLAIVTIAVSVVIMMTYHARYSCDYEYIDGQELFTPEGIEGMEEPFDSTITQASLDLEAAAGAFVIGANTENLFSFKSLDEQSGFSVLTNKKDSHALVEVSLNNNKLLEGRKNKTAIELNPSIVWNIDIEAGASSVDADLSALKIKNFELEGGACSATLKFGMLQAFTDVSIDAAASSITLYIPKQVACEILNETILTDNGFEGFTKIKRGHWRSVDYKENAANIIRIEIEAAVASINVIRY